MPPAAVNAAEDQRRDCGTVINNLQWSHPDMFHSPSSRSSIAERSETGEGSVPLIPSSAA